MSGDSDSWFLFFFADQLNTSLGGKSDECLLSGFVERLLLSRLFLGWSQFSIKQFLKIDFYLIFPNAQVFHLHDVSVERPSFLSKSFTGFILFNVVTYSLLMAELVLLTFANPSDTDKVWHLVLYLCSYWWLLSIIFQSLFLSIFNSIYAFLMLIVVIFFLIYGVEVYFKVRGAFIQEESAPQDLSQLQQSRLGLISQAVLLLITVLFMFSEVLGSFWKDKYLTIFWNIL